MKATRRSRSKTPDTRSLSVPAEAACLLSAEYSSLNESAPFLSVDYSPLTEAEEHEKLVQELQRSVLASSEMLALINEATKQIDVNEINQQLINKNDLEGKYKSGKPKDCLKVDVTCVSESHTEIKSPEFGETFSSISSSWRTAEEASTLWTLTLLEKLSALALALSISMARFWSDEKGRTPLHRFLTPDRPDHHLPSARVQFFVVLGIVLSGVALYFTEDRYITGRPSNGGDSFHVPVHIAFRSLGCEIDGLSNKPLSQATGEIKPGRLTGVMGRSGSGKTTLVNLILGRSRIFCDSLVGTVYMNGRPLSLEVILDRVGYVPQSDELFKQLTVVETLLLSAESRVPPNVELKKARLAETLKVLGLQGVQDEFVGTLSGGERKRVSIGMELITQPSVLIMDEPTSGLDSAAANLLVQKLHDIAKTGVAVVAALHQPTNHIYNLIDDLVLLHKGRLVYAGPIEDSLEYFEGIGYTVPDVVEFSAPEFLVDILAGLVTWSNESDHYLVDSWDSNSRPDKYWRSIEQEFSQLRREENEHIAEYYSHLGIAPPSLESLLKPAGLEKCHYYPSVFRFWCFIFLGLGSSLESSFFPIRAKPGLLHQMFLWFTTFARLQYRKGFALEIFVVVFLACTVAFTRSYNMTWNRRALGAFFISIALSLCGLFGALFSDEIGPVKRAADAGMVLGAYEFALILFTNLRSFLVCHLFAVSYFTVMYLRRQVWCTDPFQVEKYLEFTHVLHLLYMCAHSFGRLIMVIADHETQFAYSLSIAFFICVHTFALFSPNKHQIATDSFVFGKVDIAPIVQFFCALSYTRYFVEALMLWEPVDDDPVARNSALRFYGYHENHKTKCYTCLFAIYTFVAAVRLLLFTRLNRNVFNSLYDTPLFLIFVSKVTVAFLCALLVMTMLHEAPRASSMWKHMIREYAQITTAKSQKKKN